MSQEPKIVLEPAFPPTRIRSVLRFWPWVLLGLAALFFAVHCIPAVFLASVDGETGILALFYHDVVELHHPASDWQWGGVSALFPDVVVFFIVNFLCRDGWLALQITSVLFFLAWLAASGALAIVLKQANKLSLFSILLLLWVILACDFSYPYDWGVYIQYPLFLTLYHSGTSMLCLVCLTLVLGQVSGAWRPVFFGALFVLTFLGGVSDALFFVVFAMPALAAVGLLAVGFPRHWKNYLALGLNITIASVAAYFLASFCFPARLATGNYTNVTLDAARNAFSVLVAHLSEPEHHLYIFLLVLDALTVMGGVMGLLLFCFPSMRKQVSPVGFCLLVFCSAAILLNWAAALGTGDYDGMEEDRYLQVALILPLFLAAFGLHHIILWSRWRENLLAMGTAIFTVSVACIPLPPSASYVDAEATIPALKEIMKEHHIKAGLADYWSANLIVLLSHDTVPLRAATGDGNIFSWVNSLEWYGKGHVVQDWPVFRLIYLPDPKFKDAFGAPDQIVYTPGKEEVWLYSEARAIRYNPYFGVLSNNFLDGGRTLVMNASTLPGSIGKIQNLSRIAVEGEDSDGFLNYGPYNSLEPGHYRLTFRYACLKSPAPDKLPIYDLYVHSTSGEGAVDTAPLPCPDLTPQVFTHEFTVSKTQQQFEMRIHYQASGTVRLDSLAITYLGP